MNSGVKFSYEPTIITVYHPPDQVHAGAVATGITVLLLTEIERKCDQPQAMVIRQIAKVLSKSRSAVYKYYHRITPLPLGDFIVLCQHYRIDVHVRSRRDNR